MHRLGTPNQHCASLFVKVRDGFHATIVPFAVRNAGEPLVTDTSWDDKFCWIRRDHLRAFVEIRDVPLVGTALSEKLFFRRISPRPIP